MPVNEKIKIEIEATIDNLKKGLKEGESFLKSEIARLETQNAFDLGVNLNSLKEAKKDLIALQKEAKKVGDTEGFKALGGQIENTQKLITLTNRALTNFARTGDQELSVLGQLFDSVNKNIDKSREALLRMGKTTDGLDKLEKEISQLNEEFKQGKIAPEQYGKSLDKLESQVVSLGKKSETLGDKFTGAMKGFGVALAGFFALDQIGEFMKSAVIESAKFERALANINTVLFTSKDNLKALGDEILAVSGKYGIASDEMSNTAFNIASAGVEMQNIIPILELSSRVALASGTDTTTAFNGIIAVVKKYGLDLQQAQQVADLFFQTNVLGQTTVNDLSGSMEGLSGTVSGAGVKLTELFGIYSTLTGVTGNANEVTTQINATIESLIKPTAEAKKMFEELGIEVGASAIEQKGFLGVIEDIREKTGGNIDTLSKLITTQEGLQLVTALTGNQFDKFKENTDNLSNSQGQLDKALGEVTSGTQFKLDKMTVAWNNFKTKVGNNLTSIGYFFYDLGTRFNALVQLIAGGVAFGISNFVNFGRQLVAVGKDIIANWGVIANSFPEILKGALNKLPGILQTALNALFSKIPGGKGQEILSMLGLDKIGDKKLFDNVKGIKLEFKNLASVNSDIDRINTNFSNKFNGYLGELKNGVSTTKAEFQDLSIASQEFGSDTDKSNKKVEKEITTLNSLNNKLNKLKTDLGKTDINSKQFKDLQLEIKKTEDSIKSLNGQTTGGSKGGGGSKKEVETEKEKLDKIKKLEEQKAKEELAMKEESLKNQAKLDVEAIKQSEKTEVEKAKAILKINDKLSSDIKDLTQSKLDNEVEFSKLIIEKEKEKTKEIQDGLKTLEEEYKTSGKVFEESIKESEKNVDNFTKKIETLVGEIAKIDDSLNKLDESRGTTLGERNLKIIEEEKKLQEELDKLKQGERTTETIQAETKAQEQLNKLLDEKRLIEANATTEELAEAKRINELSPTAKFLEEFEAKKKALEEDKLLKEQELIDLQTQKINEENILKLFNDKKMALDETYKNNKLALEQQITDDLYKQTRAREDMLESLRLKALATAEAIRMTGIGGGGTATSIDNSKTVNANINVNSSADLESINRTLGN